MAGSRDDYGDAEVAGLGAAARLWWGQAWPVVLVLLALYFLFGP
jgi:hypothetical protein